MKSAVFFSFVMFINSAFGVAVYKEPDARFSSGDEPIHHLVDDGLSTTRTWFQTADKKWLKRSEVLIPLDFSREATIKTHSLLRFSPTYASFPMGTLTMGTAVTILKHDDSWTKIKIKNREGWIESKTLQPTDNEMGYVYLKSKVALQKSPSFNSEKIRFLNKMTKLHAQGISGPWIKVHSENSTGWIHIRDCFSKLNLIDQVVLKNQNEWQSVNSSEGSWIETKGALFISLDKVRLIKTKSNFLLVKQEPISLPTEFVKSEVIKWNHYYSEKSGFVWYPDKVLGDKEGSEPVSLTNEQMFKTEVFDLAAHPQLPEFKIASRNGVYKTTDNLHWHKIPRFEKENYPVHITSHGTVFVGPFVSHDGAEHFQPYLRFDRLMKAFARAGKKLPQRFAMTSVQYDEMKSVLQIGFNGDLTLESADSGKRWSLVDTENKPTQFSPARHFSIRISPPSSNQRSLQQAKSERTRLATIVSY